MTRPSAMLRNCRVAAGLGKRHGQRSGHTHEPFATLSCLTVDLVDFPAELLLAADQGRAPVWIEHTRHLLQQ